MYKLNDPACNLRCDETGLHYGSGSLLTKSSTTGWFVVPANDVLKRAGLDIEMSRLQPVANALNENNLVRAQIAALHLLPLLNNSVTKAGYRDDEPRDEHGRWTAGGGNDDDNDEQNSSDPVHDNESPFTPVTEVRDHDWFERRKATFLDTHLAETQPYADRLHVPVENLLAAAAIESKWGDSRFAQKGNNFFGLHHPALYNNGSMQSGSDGRMSTFPSYEESLRSFADRDGHLVAGIHDAKDFGSVSV